MCGIAGVWRPVAAHETKIALAIEKLRHRGPDGEGLLRNSNCILGHRRLSIVDVHGGSQPLYNEDYRIAAVYNGEIYNHKELFATLKQTHVPNSRSDGEIIVHMYEESGPVKMISSIRGMFAIALWDHERLFLARDPLGIKPLYWSRSGDSICFASEIKALLPLCSPETIKTFPPGHYFTTDGGLHAFWNLDESSASEDEKSNIGPEAISPMQERLIAELERAVQLRLMADVPVGVFLSGGLDSSLVAALMAPHVKELHSFAVGRPGSPDLQKAQIVADDLGTHHHVIHLNPPDVARALEDIVYHLESYDPDLVGSAVPTYFVSREAAKHVKVVLTGEGADELFAGYDYYRQYQHNDRLLHRELCRSIKGLHHINLQRADRMSMAHGLEARVPFLDVSFVAHAMRLPTSHKLNTYGDKFILRKAAEPLLGPDIAWRRKEQFDQGSGSSALLQQLIPGDADSQAHRYREIFEAQFPPEVHRLVAQWNHNRLESVSGN